MGGQGKHHKRCNNSIPTDGKTDIPPPSLERMLANGGCPRPDVGTVVAPFKTFALCACGGDEKAAIVSKTTCAPCCPGTEKATSAASPASCYDCIKDFCGTGEAIMANVCANAQDTQKEEQDGEDTEKKLDEEKQQRSNKAQQEKIKNKKIDEEEDEVDTLEAA